MLHVTVRDPRSSVTVAVPNAPVSYARSGRFLVARKIGGKPHNLRLGGPSHSEDEHCRNHYAHDTSHHRLLLAGGNCKNGAETG